MCKAKGVEEGFAGCGSGGGDSSVKSCDGICQSDPDRAMFPKILLLMYLSVVQFPSRVLLRAISYAPFLSRDGSCFVATS